MANLNSKTLDAVAESFKYAAANSDPDTEAALYMQLGMLHTLAEIRDELNLIYTVLNERG